MKIFCQRANAYGIGNSIIIIKVNGKWLIEEEDLQGEISSSSFFGSLFENPQIRRPDVGVLFFCGGGGDWEGSI